ncbi:MAG: NUDIX hydrolase [Planctomycetota bacterium]
MDSTNPWTVLHKDEPFTCPFFSVRSDLVAHAGGQPRAYNSIRTKMFGVAVVPVDKRGCTMLVGQYRYVLDRFTWEVPGGGARYDRPPLDSAREELSEETGYRADHWLQLVDACVAPGTSDELSKGFVAWGLQSGEAHPEPEEQLSRRLVPFAEALSMVLSGEISHLGSVAVLLSLHTRLVRGELPKDLEKLLG